MESGISNNNCNMYRVSLGLWCLMPLLTIFQLNRGS